jgi:AcrR family transcriptional regulator
VAKRGPYAKGSAKREEILDRALEVVERDGYTRISAREIARESGLSQAGLLHYFSTKEELFVEVVRRRDDAQQAGFDPLDPIGGLVEAMRINSASPGLVRMFVAVSVDSTDVQHPGHAYFAYRYARLRSLIAEAIRGQQERGEFPAGRDADATAVAFLALADGLQIQWLLDPTIDMASRLADVWELARRG